MRRYGLPKVLKHNDVFGPGENSHMNACVGFNGGRATYERYADGYFSLGDRAFRSIQEDSWDIDCLIYPLVMVYRHGIELMLKHLRFVLFSLHDEKAGRRGTHKLMSLWGDVRRHLAQEKIDKKELNAVEKILKQMVAVDEDGQVFRYPESLDGEMHLREQTLISVEQFVEQMNLVRYFLTSQEAWASEYLQQKCEWESEMRRSN